MHILACNKDKEDGIISIKSIADVKCTSSFLPYLHGAFLVGIMQFRGVGVRRLPKRGYSEGDSSTCKSIIL